MSKLRNAMLAVVASALLIGAGGSAAFADSPRVNWTGCYVGLNAGVASTTNSASIDVSGGPSLLSVDGLGSNGGAFGGQVGCDMHATKSIVIGVFGDYTWHNQDWSIGSGLLGGTLATMSVDNQWTIGARAGVLVHDNALVYALIGYTEVQTSGVHVPLLSTSFGARDFTGISVGGGMEVAVGGGLFLTGEYRYSRFDAETGDIIPGLVSLRMEPEMHAFTGRLSYRFGFGQ